MNQLKSEDFIYSLDFLGGGGSKYCKIHPINLFYQINALLEVTEQSVNWLIIATAHVLRMINCVPRTLPTALET